MSAEEPPGEPTATHTDPDGHEIAEMSMGEWKLALVCHVLGARAPAPEAETVIDPTTSPRRTTVMAPTEVMRRSGDLDPAFAETTSAGTTPPICSGRPQANYKAP